MGTLNGRSMRAPKAVPFLSLQLFRETKSALETKQPTSSRTRACNVCERVALGMLCSGAALHKVSHPYPICNMGMRLERFAQLAFHMPFVDSCGASSDFR